MTETQNIRPALGEGVFTTKDIATILGLPAYRVRHWLIEFWNKRFGEKFGGYSFGQGSNRAINFYTLIEFIAFSQLRAFGISAQKIQKFHATLSEKLNTKYPFAETKLLTDSKDVWFEYFDELIKLDGKDQIALKKILEPFLEKIEFDEAGHRAMRFFPLGKDKEVVIDPNYQFGQPTIAGTGIKVNTIYSLYLGDDDPETIAELYHISVRQVKDAIKYCETHHRKQAA